MTKTIEQAVLELWGQCRSIPYIAQKVGLEEDEVEDIVECENNYKEDKENESRRISMPRRR